MHPQKEQIDEEVIVSQFPIKKGAFLI